MHSQSSGLYSHATFDLYDKRRLSRQKLSLKVLSRTLALGEIRKVAWGRHYPDIVRRERESLARVCARAPISSRRRLPVSSARKGSSSLSLSLVCFSFWLPYAQAKFCILSLLFDCLWVRRCGDFSLALLRRTVLYLQEADIFFFFKLLKCEIGL